MKVKTGKLMRSLIRAGTRTARLFVAASGSAIPKPRRSKPRKAASPPAPRRAKPHAPAASPSPASGRTGAAPPSSRVQASATVAAVRGGRAASSSVAPGKWLSSHVLNAAGQRMSYWLYLPVTATARTASKGMPLLVMLHGCQQTATQFAQGTRMNLFAEKRGCAVLYPQQLASSHPQRCWKWYDRATQNGGGDVPTIVDMVNKVLAQYPMDRTRIYVAGISAGAGMANILALNHPRLFAAVGLHSGPVFGAGHNALGALGVMQHGAGAMHADLAVREVMQRQPPFPGMPAILIQGDSDDVVRPVNQVQLMRQAVLLNGLAGLPRTTSKRHYRLHDFYEGRRLLLRVAQVTKLGHAWSGGDPALAFNDRAGPNASRMMLDFFARHRRA